MPAPVTFCSGTAGSGVSSITVAVSTATGGGDALAVSVAIGGSSPPTVTGVTDTQSNSYTVAQSYTGASPFLYVFTATGATTVLTGSDSVTATFSGTTAGPSGIIGTDCPGVATIDVSQVANGTSTAPSVSGTPGQAGETGLAVFAWANGGGSGTISAPFTQQTQLHTGASSTYLTTAYDLAPTSGSSLTAAATITSAGWRAVLVTFEVTTAGAVSPFTLPAKPARGAQASRRGTGKGQAGAPRVFVPTVVSPFTLPVRPARGGQAKARGAGKGQQGAPQVSIPPPAINQWAATFSQPAVFGTTPPALQSVVIPLNATTSVGGGTGVPTAGNWLFCLTAMNETYTTSQFTVGVADDIHSYWRPAKVSAEAGLTRASVWYTPNLARVPADIYVAPEGAFDALAVLVVEVAGIGPWDTVTAAASNYAAAATSLNLAASAPGVSSFVIAAVAGDKDGISQAFAPAGWTALRTVTATNGADHTSDVVLTAASLSINSSSLSVTGTTASASDLSGVLVEVQINAPSPIPAGHNPAWPYLFFEAAFGSGFQTPQDEMTWTDLTSRLWSWDETTGIQYQLGQIQATELDLELDNNDQMLSVDNPAAYFYTAAGANWSPQAAFYDAQVSSGTPAAWWKLADASGAASAADSSGNSHPATATSVTFAQTSEAVTGNTAALFNGSSSHCLSSYNPALTAVSAEAWVNLNGASQSGTPCLIGNSVTSSDHKGFELILSGGTTPQAWFGNNSAQASVTASSALPATGWTYVAATWDGTTVTLYVNGVSQGTAALSGSMPAGTGSGIGVGYNPSAGSGYVSGLLAECAVYGSALTAGQIAAHFTAGPAATGTPLRIRAAIGTLGGVTQNRWYVIQRNAEMWPQQITQDAWRRYAPVTATDIWSALAAPAPTPYRGEVYQDSPYAYWPMNDQPLTSGVQPATLLNAAPGNTNVLNIAVSPNGAGIQDVYSANEGENVTSILSSDWSFLSKNLPETIGSYTVAASTGWMWGDPLASQDTYQTSNPVTSSPGSAAVQFSGQAGGTGSAGWWAYCNDPGFPPLSAGVTVEGWFNYGFLGGVNGLRYQDNAGHTYDSPFAEQPYAPLTLWEIATGSHPVAVLQLNTSGALNLITYNGSTGTTNSIWGATDLRDNSWHHYAVTMTTTAWTVYVDGGLTAKVSGTAAGMTSAWSWLILNGDLGSNGGSTAGTGLEDGGNVQMAHFAIYPAILPTWRILARYCAAITGFGVIPAPATPQITVATYVHNPSAPGQLTFTVDGTAGGGYDPATQQPGGYGWHTVQQGNPPVTVYKPNQYVFSAVVTAVAGGYHSGPSSRVTQTGYGTGISGTVNTQVLYLAWTGVSAQFWIYTAASAGAETEAEQVASVNDTLTGGYGSSSTDSGVGHLAGGDGSAFPTSPSSLGDDVGQRLERILGYGQATSTARAIDPAALLVQAASDIGGQSAGQNLGNIQQSDGGMLFIDNLGVLTYWQKSHLASQYGTPVWTIGPANTPYYSDIDWTGDPQRVWNAIQMTPFSPSEAFLPTIVPSQYQQVAASVQQYGAQPFTITNYLQSSAEMQSYANWLLQMYGILRIRAQNVKIDAAPYPAAFVTVLGINVGDVVAATNWQIGGGGATEILRVTQIKRHIVFGQEGQVEASATLQLSWEPPSYWQ